MTRMKHAICLKSPSCRYFRRLIEVKGKGHELLDDQMNVLKVEEPEELELLRRYSQVVCATHGTKAKIHLPF